MTEAQATNSTMSPEALATEAHPAPKAKRWYIIHAHSGFEKKVAQAILETAAQKGLTEAFEQVVVPTENVVEVRRGKKTASERKFFPGYVLAKMDMTDATWQIVKTTPKVTGFLGGKGIRPQPITEREAAAIFSAVEDGVASPRTTVHYDIGENVKIIDGPFESFVGVVEDVDDGRSKLKVSVSIFGRATPVELNFDQVLKVS
jgi:transcriptional antiterminator NusG